MIAGSVYRTTAQVGPGNRIEIVAPELVEGEQMEVILLPVDKKVVRGVSTIDRLLAGDRTIRDAAYWEEREKELQESRDSWER